MKARFTKRRIALIALALFLWIASLAAWRVLSIAAIQDALERDWEINFNDGLVPRMLPDQVDEAVRSLIWKLTDPEQPPRFLEQKGSRDTIWRERFRALFRGPITEIEIYYPGTLRDDLGAALARFPSLRRLSIREAGFSKSDWSYVFAGLQRLKHLEELDIGGHELRDRTIEPLSKLTNLRKVTIETGSLSTESIETFRHLPNLTELVLAPEIIDDGHDPNEMPSPEIQKMMRDNLPGVEVKFE